MSPTQMKTAATDTARSIRRRLAAAARERSRRDQSESPPRPELVLREAGESEADRSAQQADDARLDALRGELVRELDRMAAVDAGCSASFRRI
jgi:hypothetical protein